jgi:organic hydroperoxide reductase OsmC/OhrA
MMGTLAGVLAKKKIRTFMDRYMATVTGDITPVDGVLKISRIHVHYHLKAPVDKHQDAREALDNYITGCPAAQSVIGCIEITHELTLEDMPDR